LEVIFGNSNLSTLYSTGKCRKPKLSEGIRVKFLMRVRSLEAADTIYDLWKTASLHFEKMGGYDHRYSVRLNLLWRLEFEIEWQDEKQTKGKITILEISKHYGE